MRKGLACQFMDLKRRNCHDKLILTEELERIDFEETMKNKMLIRKPEADISIP